MTRHVVVRVNEAGHGSVQIDGRDVPNVRGVVVMVQAGDAARVLVELVDVTVLFDGEAHVTPIPAGA